MGLFDFLKKEKKEKEYLSPKEIDPRVNKKLDTNLLPGEVILLQWLENKSIKDQPPGYFKYRYNLKINKSRTKLLKLGYLIKKTPSESLDTLTVADLKKILEEANLSKTGKKQILIDRIKSSIPQQNYSKFFDGDILGLTDEGVRIIEQHQDLIWAHKHDSMDGIISVASATEKSKEQLEKEYKISRSAETISKKMLENLKQSKAEFYEISVVLDKHTCPRCAKMDGKTFLVSKAKPGVNFPPFHDDCRCDAAPYITYWKSSSRGYRDPKTNKWIMGEYLTYNSWKQAMITKYGKEIFEK